MAATDALMEGGQATFEKAGDKVSFELEPKTVGLTKEQLEKYRNDPFWKPVRTILFILFWLAWIAMFAAAIAIVVFSPKCAEKQKAQWWQTKISYQVLTQTFYDSNGDGEGDFHGVTEKIDVLRKFGVTTIYITPILKTYKDNYDVYEVTDHMTVDPRFGTEDDFKELIDAAHDRGMYIVMDLPISSVSLNHSWFREADADYFITINASATTRKEYYPFSRFNGTKYLGYPSERTPVVNLKNARVFNTILESAKKFLLLGVDGFHIDHINRIAINPDGSSNHTEIMSRLNSLTSSIKQIVTSHDELAEKKIVLFSSLRNIEDQHVDAIQTGGLNYIIDSDFASLSSAKCGDGLAKCVHDGLNRAYERYKTEGHVPFWQFSNPENSRLASRFDVPTANLLTFMQLTLPGAISLYYGQEYNLKDVERSGQRGIMQWHPRVLTPGDNHHGFTGRTDSIFFGESENSDNNDNFQDQFNREPSSLKLYAKLAKLRQREEALLVGETVRDTIKDEVISFSRFVKENGTATGPIYTVILNFGDNQATVALSSLEHIPKERKITNVEVVAFTTGVPNLKPRQKKNYDEENVVLPGKQGILLKL